jgi:hypothetical protein
MDFGTAVSPDDLVAAQAVLRRMQTLRPLYTEQNVSYV